MPKPSEIFNTPAATGFSRVGGNEEQRQEFGLLFGASLSYDQQLLEAIWDWHLTTKDQEKEEAVKRERSRILKEIDDSRDHDSCECDNCHRWRKYYKKALPTEDNK